MKSVGLYTSCPVITFATFSSIVTDAHLETLSLNGVQTLCWQSLKGTITVHQLKIIC